MIQFTSTHTASNSILLILENKILMEGCTSVRAGASVFQGNGYGNYIHGLDKK
jgi:uncharacterized protein YceK